MRKEWFAVRFVLEAVHFFGVALSLYQILEHFEGMVEVIFVLSPVAFLHTVESSHFRQDDFEQTAAIQVDEAPRGVGREHDFVEFFDDSLRRDDLYAFTVAL